MRLWMLVASSALGGCSFLDQIALSGPSPSSNKIYLLDDSSVHVRRTELDRYACPAGPMLCELRGATYDCGCPQR